MAIVKFRLESKFVNASMVALLLLPSWCSRKGSSSTRPKKMEQHLSLSPARLNEELIQGFRLIQFIDVMTNMYVIMYNMLIIFFLFPHIHTYIVHTYSVSSYLKHLYSYKVHKIIYFFQSSLDI